MTPEEQRLLDVLNSTMTWPSMYAFKFIVPVDAAKELKALIPEAERVEERPSSGGKYTGLTFHCAVGSAREIIEVYARVKGIKGLISL